MRHAGAAVQADDEGVGVLERARTGTAAGAVRTIRTTLIPSTRFGRAAASTPDVESDAGEPSRSACSPVAARRSGSSSSATPSPCCSASTP